MTAGGLFAFRGRNDDQMNFDGVKIYPLEIEGALLEHPEVVEAAAFAVPWKARPEVPVAVVVRRGAVSEAALQRWCVERLGRRAPRQIWLARSLPRSAMGKVLKRELRALVIKAHLAGKSGGTR